MILDSPVLTVLCSFPLLCFMDCSFRSADTKPNSCFQHVPFLLLSWTGIMLDYTTLWFTDCFRNHQRKYAIEKDIIMMMIWWYDDKDVSVNCCLQITEQLGKNFEITLNLRQETFRKLYCPVVDFIQWIFGRKKSHTNLFQFLDIVYHFRLMLLTFQGAILEYNDLWYSSISTSFVVN